MEKKDYVWILITIILLIGFGFSVYYTDVYFKEHINHYFIEKAGIVVGNIILAYICLYFSYTSYEKIFNKTTKLHIR